MVNKEITFTGQYNVSEDLKYLIQDMKAHERFITSFSRRAKQTTGASKYKSRIGKQLFENVENSFNKFRQNSRVFIPKNIQRMYQQAGINSFKFLENAPISENHKKNKREIERKLEGESFKGFGFNSEPSFFMTGRFFFFIMESLEKIDQASFKFVKPKGLLNIGLISKDYRSNISPYMYMRGRKKNRRPSYFKDIGYTLKSKGLLSSSMDLESDNGEVQEQDQAFFGLMQKDANRIAKASEKYLVKFYKASFNSKIAIDPRQIG